MCVCAGVWKLCACTTSWRLESIFLFLNLILYSFAYSLQSLFPVYSCVYSSVHTYATSPFHCRAEINMNMNMSVTNARPQCAKNMFFIRVFMRRKMKKESKKSKLVSSCLFWLYLLRSYVQRAQFVRSIETCMRKAHKKNTLHENSVRCTVCCTPQPQNLDSLDARSRHTQLCATGGERISFYCSVYLGTGR